MREVSGAVLKKHELGDVPLGRGVANLVLVCVDRNVQPKARNYYLLSDVIGAFKEPDLVVFPSDDMTAVYKRILARMPEEINLVHVPQYIDMEKCELRTYFTRRGDTVEGIMDGEPQFAHLAFPIPLDKGTGLVLMKKV